MDSMVLRQSWKGVNNEKRLQALPTETAHESYGKLTKRERARSLRLSFLACGNNRPTYGEI